MKTHDWILGGTTCNIKSKLPVGIVITISWIEFDWRKIMIQDYYKYVWPYVRNAVLQIYLYFIKSSFILPVRGNFHMETDRK